MDLFRKEYRELSDDEKAYVSLFKERAEELWHEFEEAHFLNPDPRMMAIARTKLEESVMWAVKSITG